MKSPHECEYVIICNCPANKLGEIHTAAYDPNVPSLFEVMAIVIDTASKDEVRCFDINIDKVYDQVRLDVTQEFYPGDRCDVRCVMFFLLTKVVK